MNRFIFRKSVFLVFILLIVATFISWAKIGIKEEPPLIIAGEVVERTEEHTVEVKEIRTKIMPVRAIEVYSTGGRNTTWYSGVSKADPQLKLSFKIGGTVSSIKYRKGNTLRFERLVARLDPTEYENKVENLEAALQNANVKLLKAKAKLSKVRNSFKKGAASAGDFNAALSAVKAADKAVRTYRKRVQVARRKLEYHDMRFTHRGVVSSVNVKVGDKIKAGQTIYVFNLTMPAEITVKLPAILINKIGVASKGKAKFKGLKGIYPVTVMEVGKVSTGPKATFPVTVRLRHYYKNIHAGMEAKVAFRFDYRARKKHLYLPLGAVGEDEQGKYVYVVKPSKGDYGTIERRAVVTSKLSPQGRDVFEGLSNGEVVVTHAIHRLKNGMKVKWK